MTPGARILCKDFSDKDKSLFGIQSPCHSIIQNNLWPITFLSDYWQIQCAAARFCSLGLTLKCKGTWRRGSLRRPFNDFFPLLKCRGQRITREAGGSVCSEWNLRLRSIKGSRSFPNIILFWANVRCGLRLLPPPQISDFRLSR